MQRELTPAEQTAIERAVDMIRFEPREPYKARMLLAQTFPDRCDADHVWKRIMAEMSADTKAALRIAAHLLS